MIGERFAKLTVIAAAPRAHGKRRWRCQCDCGGDATVYQWALRSGHSRSCGCARLEGLNRGRECHGMHTSPEYRTWCLIKRRCGDPNYRGFRNYGGAGITICPEWQRSFGAFLEAVGRKPSPSATLELIDLHTGYRPLNCRWADRARPGRRPKLLSAMGQTMSMREWAQTCGVPYTTLRRCLNAGMPLEQLLGRQSMAARG